MSEQHFSETDHTWDGTERRKVSVWDRWGNTLIGLIGIIIASAAIAYAMITTEDLDNRLTPLEQAPCRLGTDDIEGRKLCSASIDGIIRVITPEQAYILHRKAQRYKEGHPNE